MVAMAKRNDGKAAVAKDANVEMTSGDLLFIDAGKAKPASLQADQGTEPANQRLFAQRFLGAVASLAPDGLSVLVDFDPIAEREYPCVSEAHAVGDLLGVDEQSTNDKLEDQKLVKVADPALAIARCVREDAAASTTVRVRFLKSIFMGDPNDLALTSLRATLAGHLVLDAFAPQLLSLDPDGAHRNVVLPAEGTSAGRVVFVANRAGSAHNVVLRNSADDATVLTVEQGKRAVVFCDGTAWLAILTA